MWRTFIPLLIVAFQAVCYAAPEPESPMSHLQDDAFDDAGADADFDVLDDAVGKNTHSAYVKR